MTRTALVTGANGGIGRAIAHRLSGSGIRVVATDLAPAPADLPEGTTYVQHDLQRQFDDSSGCFDALFEAVGTDGLDYLVSAAGIALFDDDGTIFDTEESVWTRTMGVNLHALRRLTVAALPHLQAGVGKSIVNIASVAGIRGMDSPLDAYQVSKAAVVSLSRAIAQQLGPEGIRCNTVCPGAILTPMIAALYERSPDRRRDMEQRTPLRRLGFPEDIAGVTAFLLSEDAAFITATDIVVDGGWSSQLK